MDAIFAVEREIWGQGADERLASRQIHVATLVAELERYLRAIWTAVAKGGLG